MGLGEYYVNGIVRVFIGTLNRVGYFVGVMVFSFARLMNGSAIASAHFGGVGNFGTRLYYSCAITGNKSTTALGVTRGDATNFGTNGDFGLFDRYIGATSALYGRGCGVLLTGLTYSLGLFGGVVGDYVIFKGWGYNYARKGTNTGYGVSYISTRGLGRATTYVQITNIARTIGRIGCHIRHNIGTSDMFNEDSIIVGDYKGARAQGATG